MIVRNIIPAVLIHHEGGRMEPMKSYCFVQLSSGRVKPVSLLHTDDRLTSLPGAFFIQHNADDEVRKAISVSPTNSESDTQHELTFSDAIEKRFKRMEDGLISLEQEKNRLDNENEELKKAREEDKNRFARYDDENNKLRQQLKEDRKRFENENQQLKRRLVQLEKRQPNQQVSVVTESTTDDVSIEIVKVDATKYGAAVLVLYIMARECVESSRDVCPRTATRRHREQYSTIFRWEWWVRIVFLSYMLQIAMLVTLEYGITTLARSSTENLEPLPAWQVWAATTVFFYDVARTVASPFLHGGYCYYQLEKLKLLQKHPCPRRTRVFALLFAGWEWMFFFLIFYLGTIVLIVSPSPLDLILNVVALHFLFQIDDYVVQLAPSLGLIGDIDVPKVTPHRRIQHKKKQNHTQNKYSRKQNQAKTFVQRTVN